MSVNELSQLIEEYPYVPVYKVFLAKHYKNSGDESYRAALQSAALQAPDRISLYEFLHHVQAEQQSESGLEEVMSAEDDSSTTQQVVEVTEEISVAQTEIVEPTIDTSTESKEDEVFQDVKTDAEKDHLVESPPAEANAEIEPLKEEVEEQVKPTLKPSVSDKMEKLRQLALDQEAEKRTAGEELLQSAAKRKVTLDEKHTFLEWLEILEGHPADEEGQVSVEAEQAEPSPEISEEEEVAILETQIDEYSASQTYEADIRREVVDMEEHDVKSKLDEGDSAVVKDLADKSILLNTGVVTETLAKLMLMQGKKLESIALYEQLRLKYPEKSDYFAAQIEAINSK